MEDTGIRSCSLLIETLSQKGVRNVVCSPGSRNVPLLMALAAREGIKKHFVVDERSAGFFGLGLAQVKQEPVALICTSGTALLNYAPSMAEAYYQGIPLIVISADRPIQWIDQDDSQTLRQDNALENFVKKSFSIAALSSENKEMLWYVNRIANEAVNEATQGKPGPVHINVHLSEPLNISEQVHEQKVRTINILSANSFGNKEVNRELAIRLANSKVLVVAGFGPPDASLQKQISEFSKWPNVAIMAETISNLHLKSTDHSIDSVFSAFENEDLDKLAPDIVISFGGALVSRKLKEYLRRNSSKLEHWAIGYSNVLADPFTRLTLRIEMPVDRFFRNINAAMKKVKVSSEISLYKKLWKDKREEALGLKNSFIETALWSELKAFAILLSNISSDCNLFLSNGTPVRYAQLISYKLPHASFCNRGVSGIDGCLSTAIGGSIGYPRDTMMIIGDLSLTYDINALGLSHIADNFKLIVIDNQGGGIFRFIPSTSSLEIREQYLCQPPLLPLQELAQGYGWDYLECHNEKSLIDLLPVFYNSNKKIILRIICNGETSAEILKKYMDIKCNR